MLLLSNVSTMEFYKVIKELTVWLDIKETGKVEMYYLVPIYETIFMFI